MIWRSCTVLCMLPWDSFEVHAMSLNIAYFIFCNVGVVSSNLCLFLAVQIVLQVESMGKVGYFRKESSSTRGPSSRRAANFCKYQKGKKGFPTQTDNFRAPLRSRDIQSGGTTQKVFYIVLLIFFC
ncbi:hypothetical protein GIB67_007131 [Kingdonia uniflora]|uniref:Uncharacterized protein n=1 Tax=Kingdonia uniflora TaxID=39325 RepID=A0A7J7MLK2_9MAGN|nr:hypothetical protein GIB67_007131 [Kingdonia uniflora]